LSLAVMPGLIARMRWACELTAGFDPVDHELAGQSRMPQPVDAKALVNEAPSATIEFGAGLVVTTNQVLVAGAEALPAGSAAVTLKLWGPSLRPLWLRGLVHG
jgi:hypothetical protein